jgi:hypothetical protein
MEDLIQIEAGTTTKFIEDLNNNFGKIKGQFDTMNNFIFAEGSHTQETYPDAGQQLITWYYRLYTDGRAEGWCSYGLELKTNGWDSWQSSNGSYVSGLYYNTGRIYNSSTETQLVYPIELDMQQHNLSDVLKQDIGFDSRLNANGNLTSLFAMTMKPKCFMTVDDTTGNAMLFTTSRPSTDLTNGAIYTRGPEMHAIYYSSLPKDRTITVHCFVIGRWK